MKHIITSIDSGSPLEGRVHPGEALVSINGHPIEDVLDYKYYGYDAKLLLQLETPEGKLREVRIRKDAGEDPGLSFETYLMDRARACCNRCVFCFVDQLPRGMRKTLYFKDDDARLSFLTGNYITLTNLSDRELQRIIDLRISPINVSVHATEPEMRALLLGNPAGAEGYRQMQRLAEGGITMNCQIVCCPGLNDGDVLRRSMEDLAALHPQVRSVSIVPVGLTKHREKLYPLTPFDKERALATVRQVEAFADTCMANCGSRIFFCSDELYLKAGLPLPEDEYYEDYPQLENGVGMLRLLQFEFMCELGFTEPEDGECVPFAIATGCSAAPFLENLMLTAAKKCDNIKGNVYAIKNDFFGHTIDVAGLITGRDLIAQLRGKDLGQRLLIPRNMLRHEENVFLDDVTVEEVSAELGVPVISIPQDGGALLRAMLHLTD